MTTFPVRTATDCEAVAAEANAVLAYMADPAGWEVRLWSEPEWYWSLERGAVRLCRPPTVGGKLPRWVRVRLKTVEEDGLVPGSYIVLWTDYPGAGVRVESYEVWTDTADLDTLWVEAEVLR